MNLDLGNLPRTIWVEKSEGGPVVGFVDQRLLPDDLALVRTAEWREVVDAVKTLAGSRRAGYRRGGGGGGDAGRLRVRGGRERRQPREARRSGGRWRFREGGRSCRFRPSLGRGCPRDHRGAADGGQLVLGACAGPWEAAQEARSAGKTAAEAAEALYGARRGPHCRGRGGEPPYRRPWGHAAARDCG